MGMSELRSPQCYLHSDYKSQIVDGRINRKKCTVCEFNFCKQTLCLITDYFGLKARLNRRIKIDNEKQNRQTCSLCSSTFPTLKI